MVAAVKVRQRCGGGGQRRAGSLRRGQRQAPASGGRGSGPWKQVGQRLDAELRWRWSSGQPAT
eukprot:13943805-Alexandrium_andersonii.AAC.1